MSDNSTAPVTTTRLREGIAEEVRALLARRRMSASKLAEKLGWTQQYISRRMVADQPFDADDLEAIAAALGVSVVDLLPRDGYIPVQRTHSGLHENPGPLPRIPRQVRRPPRGPSHPSTRPDTQRRALTHK